METNVEYNVPVITPNSYGSVDIINATSAVSIIGTLVFNASDAIILDVRPVDIIDEGFLGNSRRYFNIDESGCLLSGHSWQMLIAMYIT